MNFKTLLTSTAAFLLAASAPAVAEGECMTIAEIACGSEDFETLCAAVSAAGLAETLSGGEFTGASKHLLIYFRCLASRRWCFGCDLLKGFLFV